MALGTKRVLSLEFNDRQLLHTTPSASQVLTVPNPNVQRGTGLTTELEVLIYNRRF